MNICCGDKTCERFETMDCLACATINQEGIVLYNNYLRATPTPPTLGNNDIQVQFCDKCGQKYTGWHYCTPPPITIERLRELKELVEDGLYTDKTKAWQYEGHYERIGQSEIDLLALIEEAIQKQEGGK